MTALVFPFARPSFLKFSMIASVLVFATPLIMTFRDESLNHSDMILFVLLALFMLLMTRAVFILQKNIEPDGQLVRDIATSLFSFVYIAIPMSLLLVMAFQFSASFAALIVVASKCGDMGGYLVGSKIGKRRVFPHVSPKKSWEGSTGGLILTLGVLLAYHFGNCEFFADFSIAEIILLGCAINLATQMGDFSESMIKRCCAVKDSAALLPTFGGSLDILDSLVFAVPVATAVITFIR